MTELRALLFTSAHGSTVCALTNTSSRLHQHSLIPRLQHLPRTICSRIICEARYTHLLPRASSTAKLAPSPVPEWTSPSPDLLLPDPDWTDILTHYGSGYLQEGRTLEENLCHRQHHPLGFREDYHHLPEFDIYLRRHAPKTVPEDDRAKEYSPFRKDPDNLNDLTPDDIEIIRDCERIGLDLSTGLFLDREELSNNCGTDLGRIGLLYNFHRARLPGPDSCAFDEDSVCGRIYNIRATGLAVRDSLNQDLDSRISNEQLGILVEGWHTRRDELRYKEKELLKDTAAAASKAQAEARTALAAANPIRVYDDHETVKLEVPNPRQQLANLFIEQQRHRDLVADQRAALEDFCKAEAEADKYLGSNRPELASKKRAAFNWSDRARLALRDADEAYQRSRVRLAPIEAEGDIVAAAYPEFTIEALKAARAIMAKAKKGKAASKGPAVKKTKTAATVAAADDGAPGPAPKPTGKKTADGTDSSVRPYNPDDCKLALNDAIENGKLVANRVAGTILPNPATEGEDELIYVASHKPDGTAYSSRGKYSRNYPILVPRPFDEALAERIVRFLGYNYTLDEEAWKTISSRQLPPECREREWFVEPDPSTHPFIWEVYNYSPHAYIWMMAARVIDGHGVVTPYSPAFSTVYVNPTYRPFDNRLPPSGLLEHEHHRRSDMVGFHGMADQHTNRPWRFCLSRTRESGLTFIMPHPLEILRTSPSDVSMDGRASTNPMFHLTHYLFRLRLAVGYHDSPNMSDLLANGTWDAKTCPFYDMANVLREYDEDDNVDDKSHQFSAEEFYYILSSVYHIRPELAFDFVAYTRLIGDCDKGIDLRRILVMFEFMDHPEKDDPEKPFADDIKKHYLPTDPLRQSHIVVPGHLDGNQRPLGEARIDMGDWKDDCELEHMSNLARALHPVDSVLAKPSGHAELQVGSIRGPVTELENVSPNLPDGFHQDYFWSGLFKYPVRITDFDTKPAEWFQAEEPAYERVPEAVLINGPAADTVAPSEEAVAPVGRTAAPAIHPDTSTADQEAVAPTTETLGGAGSDPTLATKPTAGAESVPVGSTNDEPTSGERAIKIEAALTASDDAYFDQPDSQPQYTDEPDHEPESTYLSHASSRQIPKQTAVPTSSLGTSPLITTTSPAATTSPTQQSPPMAPRGKGLTPEQARIKRDRGKYSAALKRHETATTNVQKARTALRNTPAENSDARELLREALEKAKVYLAKQPLPEEPWCGVPNKKKDSDNEGEEEDVEYDDDADEPEPKKVTKKKKKTAKDNTGDEAEPEETPTKKTKPSKLNDGEAATEFIPSKGSQRGIRGQARTKVENSKTGTLLSPEDEEFGDGDDDLLFTTTSDRQTVKPANLGRSILSQTPTKAGPTAPTPVKPSPAAAPIMAPATPGAATPQPPPSNAGSSSRKPRLEPATPAWRGHGLEQPRDGPIEKAPRLDAWTQLAAAAAIEAARKIFYEGVATSTPRDGTYQLWSPDRGRNLPLIIRFDSTGRPFLADAGILFYFCLASDDESEEADPPANVHLADREVGRLYYLVQIGARDLAYIVTKYPHVFNSAGALWDNRLPQGEPSLLWRPATNERLAGTEYALAFGFYVLRGDGDHQGDHLRPKKYSDEIYAKALIAAAKRDGDPGPALLHETGHDYNEGLHRFPWVIDFQRLNAKVVSWALQLQGRNQDNLHAGLVDFANRILSQLANREEMLARPAKPLNLHPKVSQPDQWWISSKTLVGRWVQMAVLGERPFQPQPTTVVRLTYDRIVKEALKMAQHINDSQLHWQQAFLFELQANDTRAAADAETLDDGPLRMTADALGAQARGHRQLADASAQHACAAQLELFATLDGAPADAQVSLPDYNMKIQHDHTTWIEAFVDQGKQAARGKLSAGFLVQKYETFNSGSFTLDNVPVATILGQKAQPPAPAYSVEVKKGEVEEVVITQTSRRVVYLKEDSSENEHEEGLE